MDLMKAIDVSASGMSAQSARMQMISENIANAESVVTESGGPYRRKTIQFETVLNRHTGLQEVQVRKISPDYTTPLKQVYNPGHEMADENGYVAHPNVNTLLENVDMRDASRMYEANMKTIEVAKEMMVRSIDLLR